MSETNATLSFGDKQIELPVVTGTENEQGIDISKLRSSTGLITLDNGFGNTGSCRSSITFINGEEGILRYRGIPIDQIVEQSNFVETCYLLINGHLPNQQQLSKFSSLLNNFSILDEDMRIFFNFFPRKAHPMNILGTMVNALSSFYPNVNALSMEKDIEVTSARLISQIRTIACFAHKRSVGEPVVYPDHNLSYCENFLNMMFKTPVNGYEIDPLHVQAMNALLILHADHEQNCSTSTVRLVGSSQANLYASISAGISALWGPLHGGANQAVMEMLEAIHASGDDIHKWIERAKDKSNAFRLSGFGHRVYKNFDPRATLIKDLCREILMKGENKNPLLEIAMELEDAVLQDDYFIERRLYPNVDFYSGLLYKAMGFPEQMFTVIFAIGRIPGWIAHWREMINDPQGRIGRPRQVYVGNRETNFTPMDQR